jgi:hypothetical protein
LSFACILAVQIALSLVGDVLSVKVPSSQETTHSEDSAFHFTLQIVRDFIGIGALRGGTGTAKWSIRGSTFVGLHAG